MIGRKNWVQKLLYKQKSPNQPNQIQIIIERGDPLFAQKERPVQVIRKSKHVLLVTARTSIFDANANHFRTGRPVVCSERAPHSSDHDTSQTRLSRDSKHINFEDVNHYRTGRPVVCSQRAHQTRSSRDCKSIDLDEETDHYRTGRPVVCSQQEGSMSEEVDIDFRISGLPHSVVKQIESSRVRDLIKKIENHPHRQDLQFDLRQNKAYNPFSERSKKMIKDIGNVELFDLCETNPKTQCTECLLYWSEGIVYCTCGHLLRESAASRGTIQWTLDLLSIPTYVIKKGRRHGNRHGKTKEQRDHFVAHNLRRRCRKRGFEGIHDRFLKMKDFVNLNSNMIELKKSVSRWTRSRKKNSPIM